MRLFECARNRQQQHPRLTRTMVIKYNLVSKEERDALTFCVSLATTSEQGANRIRLAFSITALDGLWRYTSTS